MVSQAAWIRSLTATYVRPWEGRRTGIGGLFGARVGEKREVLPWSRAQQAAFLIMMGKAIRAAIAANKETWTEVLRKKGEEGIEKHRDVAFYGKNTLLNTDQGIRGILHVTNDLAYVAADELNLGEWTIDTKSGASDEAAVSAALKSVERQRVARYVQRIVENLAKYDWRTSSAPGLKEDERTLKGALRGSGGYKELRRQLLKHLTSAGGEVGTSAKAVLSALGYR